MVRPWAEGERRPLRPEALAAEGLPIYLTESVSHRPRLGEAPAQTGLGGAGGYTLAANGGRGGMSQS